MKTVEFAVFNLISGSDRISMPQEESEFSEWFYREVHPYEEGLRAWLAARFSNRSDIDDIVQESYKRMLEAKRRGEITAPKAYLYSTARNIGLNLIRRAKVRGDHFTLEFDDANIVDAQEAVNDTVAHNQELAIMTEAIQRLPERCRQVFTLRHVYGLSQKAIAEKLGISHNTVNAQTAIGLNKCAAYMDRFLRERENQ